MPADDPLATFTLAQLADLLQVSERYVQAELIAGRRIDHLRISPKVVRVTREQLATFYAEATVSIPRTSALAVVSDTWRAA